MVESANKSFILKGDEFRKQADAKRKGSFFGNLMNSKD